MGCAPLPLTPRPPGRVPWGRELEEKVEQLEEKLAKQKHKAKCGATPHTPTPGAACLCSKPLSTLSRARRKAKKKLAKTREKFQELAE